MSAWTCRSFDGKAAVKIVPPRPRIPWWKGLGADSEEKREPVSDIDTEAADSLKALDPKRPLREADMTRLAASSTRPLVTHLRHGHPQKTATTFHAVLLTSRLWWLPVNWHGAAYATDCRLA